jgi:hypothetical protein
MLSTLPLRAGWNLNLIIDLEAKRCGSGDLEKNPRCFAWALPWEATGISLGNAGLIPEMGWQSRGGEDASGDGSFYQQRVFIKI